MSRYLEILLTTVVCGSALAQSEPTSDDSITIYSRMQPGAVAAEWYRPTAGRQNGGNVPGYAIVRHDRPYRIERGLHTLRVSDVAALIDPTTVTFNSLDSEDIRVLEQSFQFDLVSQEKLLQRYLGQRISVEQPRGEQLDVLEGTLLGIGDGLTLQMEDGSVTAIHSYSNLKFSELPGGLITRPTLEWLLQSPAGGTRKTRITYETQGMTWWADYNLILDEAEGCALDLTAWVSIINQSGAGYHNARLKLIAGDVNRAQPQRMPSEIMYRMAVAEDSAGFKEKSFFEYHLYTLGRRTSLPDNSTRQIELIPAARHVNCSKELIFAPTMAFPWQGYQQLEQEYGRGGESGIEVYLRFPNEEKNHLGMPLPAGRVRVNQLDDADGSLEFIGEDVIDHTPRNEDVLIHMGNAFDIVGERTQTDYRVDLRTRNLWESFEIKLRNHKTKAADIKVLENLYRTGNWKIEDSNFPFAKENASQVRFDVKVPSEAETVISYTVHYTW